MKKEYKLPEENNESNNVEEPAIKYGLQAETEMTFSPPLTEEELKNALTTDEVIKIWCDYIDKKFEA